jgi:predicted house-cleaning noncanonical NTP pyrophosphatase (MazG superfamily)
MVHKLVRDNIPVEISRRGATPDFRTASREEVVDWLKLKLQEEVLEFLKSDDPAELADIYEVVLALWRRLHIGRDQPGTPARLSADAVAKRMRLGAFDLGVILMDVIEPKEGS